MARESVLTTAEKDAIKIEKLIFHIILKDQIAPIFLDKVIITESQQKFFKARLSDAAQGRQHVFVADSLLRPKAVEILSADDDNFVRLSKEIAHQFKLAHTNNTSDGVFIVSVASIGARKLLFLVKIDHKTIYQYKLKGNQALLEEVKNTFSEDKSAIQKVALVDTSNRAAWDVLTTDRGARGADNYITNYFRNFLGVNPRETDTDLTKKALSAARKWAMQNKVSIDPKQEISLYKNRAKEYLLNHDRFDTAEFIEAVIQDPDTDRRENLKNSFHSFLQNEGIAGQTFTPKSTAIPSSVTKNIRKTAEGVRIEWEGTPKEHGIYIPNTANANGVYEIRIRTSNIEEIQ